MDNIETLVSAIKELKYSCDKINESLNRLYDLILRIEYSLNQIRDDIDYIRNHTK